MFVSMAIYVFTIKIDLRQFQFVTGLVLVCLAIMFVLLTAQGVKR